MLSVRPYNIPIVGDLLGKIKLEVLCLRWLNDIPFLVVRKNFLLANESKKNKAVSWKRNRQNLTHKEIIRLP